MGSYTVCFTASPKELISVMREVTGNRHLVLHHTRHTFHNQLAAVLFGIDTPLTQTITQHIDRDAVLSVVLGPNAHINRRSPMALSLLMGHTHPSTALNSYNHLVTEWADQLIPIPKAKVHKLHNAVQMDDWEKWKRPKVKQQVVVNYEMPTLRSLTDLMRLVALGRTFEQAAIALEIELKHAHRLEALFTAVTGNDVESVGGIPNVVRAFLERISESAWIRLQSHVSEPVDVSLTNPIKLRDLPFLVGNKKRHVLMAREEHYALVSYLIRYFELSSDCFHVAAYNDSKLALEKLRDCELDGSLDLSGRQLDLMTWIMDDGTTAPHRNYAAFWLKDRVMCSLRNSYEAVLMLMLIGYVQSA